MAAAAARILPGSLAVAPFEGGEVVGFEADKGSIEHFPARHDDDVQAGRDLVAPEHFARQALGAVAIDGRPELPCSGNPESPFRSAIRNDEHGHETAVDPRPGLVGALELTAPADALGP